MHVNGFLELVLAAKQQNDGIKQATSISNHIVGVKYVMPQDITFFMKCWPVECHQPFNSGLVLHVLINFDAGDYPGLVIALE